MILFIFYSEGAVKFTGLSGAWVKKSIILRLSIGGYSNSLPWGQERDTENQFRVHPILKLHGLKKIWFIRLS